MRNKNKGSRKSKQRYVEEDVMAEREVAEAKKDSLKVKKEKKSEIKLKLKSSGSLLTFKGVVNICIIDGYLLIQWRDTDNSLVSEPSCLEGIDYWREIKDGE